MLKYVDTDFFCQCDSVVARIKSDKKYILSKFECVIFELQVEAESLTCRRIWSQSSKVQISIPISASLSEL